MGQRPGFVVFEVLDRGPGFPADLLEKLFHPFVQSAPWRSPGRATGGRRWAWGWRWWPGYARAHGGSVRAENRAGGGAQLVLELAERPPAPRRRERALRSTQRGGWRPVARRAMSSGASAPVEDHQLVDGAVELLESTRAGSDWLLAAPHGIGLA